MAKALYGHVGQAPNKRLLEEVAQLRARVRNLEYELAQLRARESEVHDEAEELVRLSEPALT
jgi:predicted  nucleic acid-binding Zn-ribbon protein